MTPDASWSDVVASAYDTLTEQEAAHLLNNLQQVMIAPNRRDRLYGLATMILQSVANHIRPT